MEKENSIMKRMRSLNSKLLVFPIFLVSLAIIVLSVINIYFSKEELMERTEKNGFNVAQRYIGRMEDNDASIRNINSLLEEKIRIAGKMIIENKESIT